MRRHGCSRRFNILGRHVRGGVQPADTEKGYSCRASDCNVMFGVRVKVWPSLAARGEAGFLHTGVSREIVLTSSGEIF